MTRHLVSCAGTVLLTACLSLALSAPAFAQDTDTEARSEATVRVGVATESTTTTAATAAAEPNMDAPGRSSVPAPAFGSLPRIERRNDYSAQNMAVELRFGPYAPRVDDSAGSAVRECANVDLDRHGARGR